MMSKSKFLLQCLGSVVVSLLLFSTLLIVAFYNIDTQPGVLWIPKNVQKRSAWHFAILTWGSRGDIEPMVALGVFLLEKGHNVTITVRARYAHLIPKGFNVYIMPEDSTENIIPTLLSFSSPLEDALFINKYWGDLSSVWMQEWQNIPNVDAYIASAYVHLPALQLAKQKNVPIFGVNFIPSFPTTSFADFMATDGEIWNFSSSFLNWASYIPSMILQSVFMRNQSIFEPQIAFSRKGWGSYPQFFLHPPQMFLKPHDIPSWFHFTGPFMLSKGEMKNDKLANFLREHPNSLYIGLGSMEGHNVSKFTSIVARALLQAQKPAILLEKSFDGELLTSLLPNGTYFISKEYNHQQLFPQVSAVIHHGGAGHVSMTCLAQKPSIIIPFFFEQRVWAVQAKPFGALSIDIKELTHQPDDKAINLLHNAILEVYTNSDLHIAASNCNIPVDGAKLASEHTLSYMNYFASQQ